MPSPPAERLVTRAGDLAGLRAAQGLGRVVIDTARLKYRNLLPHALKYGIWSLAPGGTLLVRDRAPNTFDLGPRFVSGKLLRQWVFKLLAEDAELVRLDIPGGEIELVRTRPPTPPGWSAGVVFSGRDAELPQLRACLDALLRQPELAMDGEIMVSGPAGAEACLDGYPAVRYRAFDLPPGPRVMIGRKKNDLIRALRGPRIAILHTRILLDPDCLARVPAEFEILSPRVFTSGSEDYLSLGVHDSGMPGRVPLLAPNSLRRLPVSRYLELFDQGPAYVDGGVFFVRKDIHARCPLHAHVAWDEVEDIEWSARALAEGILIDLAPAATARSAVSKLRPPGGLPRALLGPARRARAAMQAALHRGRDRVLRLIGRR